MAVVKTLIIQGEDNLDSTIASVERLDDSLDKTQQSAAETDQELKKVGENSGAIATLDRFTGGLASQIRDAAEASKLFGTNLRVALVATGIGALVATLAIVVLYWEEIVDFVKDYNREIERSIELQNTIQSRLEFELELLRKQNRTRELRGELSAQDLKNEKDKIDQLIRSNELELIQLEVVQRRAAARAAEITIGERIRGLATGGIAGFLTGSQEDTERLAEVSQRIRDLRLEIEALTGDSEEAANKIREIVFDNRQREEELVLPTYGVTVPELETGFQTELDLTQAQLTARRNLEESEADARRRIAEEEAEAKILLQQNVAQAVQAAAGIIGRETAVGKTLAVAATLINTYTAISGQLKAFSGVPIPGYAIAQAIATGLVGFEQVRNILAVNVPGGGAAPGGGAPSRPPAFNVVDTSAENQLNTALLEQNNEPVQAFVVEGEVSSAEELRRGKISASSIG